MEETSGTIGEEREKWDKNGLLGCPFTTQLLT
jgi:hypothetical protein